MTIGEISSLQPGDLIRRGITNSGENVFRVRKVTQSTSREGRKLGCVTATLGFSLDYKIEHLISFTELKGAWWKMNPREELPSLSFDD